MYARLMSSRPALVFLLAIEISIFVAAGWPGSASARVREDPVFATSEDDPALRASIMALSPTVRPDEAAAVAQCAYSTGTDLKREWRVVWPPGLQNFLVHTGRRKGGLCFQWAEELLVRLYLLRLQTLEFHWAEAYPRTASEHNVVVVTAKGQPFSQGILLDNWRYGGRLVWGPVRHDSPYQWKENPDHYQFVVTEKFRARTQRIRADRPAS